MKQSENMLEADDIMNPKPSTVCDLPSAPNTKSQLNVDCPEASLVGRDKGEAKPATGEGAPTPTVGTMKMQTSNVCHKNFVIVDRCEGQSTVILHPSWLQGVPHLSLVEPARMQEVNCFLDSLQMFDSKSIDAMHGFHSYQASPAFGVARVPALELQQKLSNMQKSGIIDVASCEAHNLMKQVMRTSAHSHERESLSSDFHENTEEINALLSSDDELSSTGHSPSDGVLYGCSETMNDLSTSIVGKKRKLDVSAVDEVDDADSAFSKLAPDNTPFNVRMFGSSNSLQSPIKSNHKSFGSGVARCNASGKNIECLTCDVAEHLEGYQLLPQSSGSPHMLEGGLMDSSKRLKIKGNVQQLRNVIPGGNYLDTAGVLGRTIHYVKCLQSRLRGLEAARESARAMPQIG
ncbi:hypothetical protein GOP47_0008885 [Adiantum capillus-veneris]|uniref:BHLH domain-containing protein n=1 Tax=Adiantum capillus-veneris TaxID=13818 RepID=A0A9D4UZT7_ADICA|nr:hypothetical protein GOP47_0008885 [Adiantum capillus-veneris]